MAETKENPLLKFYEWFTAAQNVWNVATSFGVALLVPWLYPKADWKTATPWLAVGFAFSGAWGVVQLIRTVARAVHRRWNPTSATVSVSGGRKAAIHLTHKGAPTTYTADGRIISLLDADAVNPAEHMFRCQLLFKGTEGGWDSTLREDDWCLIVLGEIVNIESLGSVISIRRGPMGAQTVVPDPGCVMEFVIRANPPLKSGKSITKRYRIQRQGFGLQASEVRSDT
jgi:hypothetical protein